MKRAANDTALCYKWIVGKVGQPHPFQEKTIQEYAKLVEEFREIL